MFLLYNIVSVAIKYYGIHLGYQKGVEAISSVGGGILQRLSNIANVVGLMVVGGLIATSVKMSLKLEFGAGENVILMQDLLNKIMPGLLSLLVTLVVYLILKKTNGKHAPLIILGIMLFSILAVTFGIL